MTAPILREDFHALVRVLVGDEASIEACLRCAALLLGRSRSGIVKLWWGYHPVTASHIIPLEMAIEVRRLGGDPEAVARGREPT